MPTYITLASWTQEGIGNIKDSPSRLDKVKEMYREAGVELKAFYMTMGRFDMVVIAEAPNDDAIARLALVVGSSGSVRSETLKAFTEEEYRTIVGSLP